MAVVRGAPHVTIFNANITAVDRLVEIHASVAGSGPGRKRDVEVLNKSAIVLLCACWEAYVEDLASAAVDELLARVDDPLVVPVELRVRIGET